MTQPVNNNGGEHLFSFSPKDLLLYMSELMDRIGRTGDRIEIYIANSSDRKIVLNELEQINPVKDKE